ncbi:MAG: prolipoprotein diacylglyceryl transferase [bacterium]|nr:prolipoprotein diacylglyceryl transferase [bacterium]
MVLHWNADPVLLTLGPVVVRWYGLFFASGFLVGFNLIERIYRQEKKPVADLDSLLWHMMLGTVLGARLGHCLFYEPDYYLGRPLEILKIWQGGLASHGAAVGILLSLYLYSRKHINQPFLWLVDRMSIVVALGGSFIRLGNLFNSEIIGRPTDVPWAMVLERIDSLPRHPTQIYESLAYLLTFGLLLMVYRRRKGETPGGLLFSLFLVCVFSFRFIVEFFKERNEAFDMGLGVNMGQLLSLPLILLGFWLLHRALYGRNLHHPEGRVI